MRRLSTNLIVIGIAAALAFWLVESTVDAIFFETGSLPHEIFNPAPQQAWMRLLVVVVILAFAVYAHGINVILERRMEERTRELGEVRREAERLAVEQERQRLAADLHDSVSQTLFSISLIADAVPRLWDQDPEQARVQMGSLSQLARAALGEMRALLLELRPESLAGANPGELLRHVVDSVSRQGRLEIDTQFDCVCSHGPTLNVALYRIVQEALNNVARHSGASRARVNLRCDQDGVVLEVSDDGCGFDPEAVPPEKIGIRLMRERAAGSGAEFDVDSHPGRGTRVIAVWDAQPGQVCEGD